MPRKILPLTSHSPPVTKLEGMNVGLGSRTYTATTRAEGSIEEDSLRSRFKIPSQARQRKANLSVQECSASQSLIFHESLLVDGGDGNKNRILAAL